MIHLHDWYVACLVHFNPELVVKILKNTDDERFDRSKLFHEHTITIHKKICRATCRVASKVFNGVLVIWEACTYPE